MKIHFLSPPLTKQKGGVENAIEGLRCALHHRGIEIADAPCLDDPGAIHHFHGLWNPVHSRIAVSLKRSGVPYVLSPHGMLEPWAFRHRSWKKKPYFHLIEKRFLRNAAAIFVTSEMERDNLRKVFAHPNIKVLPIGCRDTRAPAYDSARLELGWKPDEKKLLFLSRIDPKKGLDLLIEGLSKCPDMKMWSLVVVGDGDEAYVRELKNLAVEKQALLPRIEWLGAVWGDERWKYLQAADLFCLTTHSENFGISVLEALHVGTPVLTTENTPWADFRAIPGFHICEPEIGSIAESLPNAAAESATWNQANRDGLSDWARNRFSWNELSGRYVAYYQELIDSSK